MLDTDRHNRHLYKWIKQPQTEGLLTDVDVRTHATTPLEMADHRATTWGNLWQRDARLGAQLTNLRTTLVRAARTDPLPPITLHRFDQAIHSQSNNTGRGVDQHGPQFFKRLPDQATQRFVDLLNVCQQLLTWPTTLLLNIIAMQPKPRGAGERPICLIPYSIRAWQRCHRPEANHWSLAHAGHWDDCIKHSSSLQAALVRLLKDEVAHEWGLAVGTVLWDLTKYYNSISLVN